LSEKNWLGTALATALIGPFNARFSATKIFLVGKFWWRWAELNRRP